MNIIEQIKALPEKCAIEAGRTVTEGQLQYLEHVTLFTSDLKALAESHEQLLSAVKNKVKYNPDNNFDLIKAIEHSEKLTQD